MTPLDALCAILLMLVIQVAGGMISVRLDAAIRSWVAKRERG